MYKPTIDFKVIVARHTRLLGVRASVLLYDLLQAARSSHYSARRTARKPLGRIVVRFAPEVAAVGQSSWPRSGAFLRPRLLSCWSRAAAPVSDSAVPAWCLWEHRHSSWRREGEGRVLCPPTPSHSNRPCPRKASGCHRLRHLPGHQVYPLHPVIRWHLLQRVSHQHLSASASSPGRSSCGFRP